MAEPRPQPVYSAGDPQTWFIPYHIHFIWLGQRAFVTINSPARFEFNQVLQNVGVNASCEPTLWVDAFSMATNDQITFAVGPRLCKEYYQMQSLINMSDPPLMQRANRNELRSKAGFETIMKTLFKIRPAWQDWLMKPDNQALLFSQAGLPLNMMREAVQGIPIDSATYGTVQLMMLDFTYVRSG